MQEVCAALEWARHDVVALYSLNYHFFFLALFLQTFLTAVFGNHRNPYMTLGLRNTRFEFCSGKTMSRRESAKQARARAFAHSKAVQISCLAPDVSELQGLNFLHKILKNILHIAVVFIVFGKCNWGKYFLRL